MTAGNMVRWVGRGYPGELQAIADRFQPGCFPTLDVGRGWWALLVELDAQLQQLNPGYTVTRVRAVSGELRFEVVADALQRAFHEVIRLAQEEARRTCERCARPGRHRETSHGRSVVLCDEHARPLTDEEIAFAIAGGVPAAVFRAEGHLEAALCAATAGVETIGPHLTAAEVAALLHTDVARVDEMLTQGQLARAEDAGTVVYPSWQFTAGGRALPGLREVLAAFPSEFTPLDVETVMTRPQEELDNRSPVDWLASGQPTAAAVEFVGALVWR